MMKPKTLWDLVSPVLLTLSVYVRNTERKRPPAYDEVRAAIRDLLTRLEREAERADLEALWLRARSPLVYLIDELMVLDLEWGDENRRRWSNETFEVTYLGKPQTMRALDFFKECDEIQKEFVGKASDREREAKQALLEVFFVCLKLGFKGRYRRQEETPIEGVTLKQYIDTLFEKLPARELSSEGRLCEEAYRSTDQREAEYTFGWTVKTCLAVLTVIALMYSLVTWHTWHSLTENVATLADQIKKPVAQSPVGGGK